MKGEALQTHGQRRQNYSECSVGKRQTGTSKDAKKIYIYIQLIVCH